MAGLLDFVFPPKCVACGALGRNVCAACARACAPIVPPICDACGHPIAPRRGLGLGPDHRGGHRCPFTEWSLGGPPAFDRVRSVAAYDGPLKAAIRAFKYHRALPVERFLVDVLVAGLPRDWNVPFTATVAVPLHPSRLRERGFNQAEILARAAAAVLGVPLRLHALVRRRQEGAQAGLDARARRLNVVGAFAATPAAAGQALLLVDDVFSTGATADACAAALRRAGASSVSVLTLARAVLAAAPAGREDVGDRVP